MASLPVPTRRLAACALLVVVALVLALRHGRGGGAAGATSDVPPAAAVASPAPAPQPSQLLVVDVEGAVHAPGLVRLAKGSRVADAVARAGGLTPKADHAGLDLAAPVSDGEQVLVPSGAVIGAAPLSGGGSSSAPPVPISLNAATAEQLDALPGVGPATAQKIVAYRQQHGVFRSIDELDAIPGIGPARLAEWKGLLTP